MNSLREDVPPNPCWADGYAEKTKVTPATRSSTRKDVSLAIHPFVKFVTWFPDHRKGQLQVLCNFALGHRGRTPPHTEQAESPRQRDIRHGRARFFAGGSRSPILSE